MRKTTLDNSVVVITGASSGIGRATALEFAKEGANIVLAARSKRALREVAAECKEHAVEALVVPTDVSDEDEVKNLATSAVDEFGRIDIWVNNAGVGLYAGFEESPPDDFRQVLETNLFGCIYGARAALRQFREQGTGVMINVSSQIVLGGLPYSSAYGISKHGIRALGDHLRQELVDTDIHVCTVFPSSTDTAFFQHSANYTGREVKPLGGVSDPVTVAQEIIKLSLEPKPEVVISKSGYLMALGHAIAPRAYDRVIALKTERDHFKKSAAAHTKGNLYAPVKPNSITGGWRRSSVPKKISAVAMAGVGTSAALAYWYNRRRRSRPEDWRTAA